MKQNIFLYVAIMCVANLIFAPFTKDSLIKADQILGWSFAVLGWFAAWECSRKLSESEAK